MKQCYVKARKNEIEQTMQELLAHLDKENMRVIDVVFIRDSDFYEEMIVVAEECYRNEPKIDKPVPVPLVDPEDMSERWAELLHKGDSDE